MEKKTCGQKVKGHFKKYKVKYIVGGTCLVAGGTIGYYVSKHYHGVNMNVISKVEPTNVAIGKDITIKNKTNITNNVTNVNMGGYATKIVKRLSDGELFPTVGEAAKEAGVDKSVMSKHINGHSNDVNGEKYKIYGLGVV